MFVSFRALLQSQVDAEMMEEASKTCRSTIQFALIKVPSRILDVLRLKVCTINCA